MIVLPVIRISEMNGSSTCFGHAETLRYPDEGQDIFSCMYGQTRVEDANLTLGGQDG
jgi:hypothetical protein